jgi:hypothetical protein
MTAFSRVFSVQKLTVEHIDDDVLNVVGEESSIIISADSAAHAAQLALTPYHRDVVSAWSTAQSLHQEPSIFEVYHHASVYGADNALAGYCKVEEVTE